MSMDTKALIENKEVFLYNIRKETKQDGSNSYRAADWDISSPNWSGQLRVTVVNKVECLIQLIDDDGIYGRVLISEFPSKNFVPVTDSSRYFTVEIRKKKKGKKNFVGIGFSSREDSSDVVNALRRHFDHCSKRIRGEKVIVKPPEERPRANKQISASRNDRRNERGKRTNLDLKEMEADLIPVKRSRESKQNSTSRSDSRIRGRVERSSLGLRKKAAEVSPAKRPRDSEQKSDHRSDLRSPEKQTYISRSDGRVRERAQSPVVLESSIPPQPKGSLVPGQFYPPDYILAQTNDREYEYVTGDVFKCHLCTLTFSDPQKITTHWMRNHQLDYAACCTCRLPFPTTKERLAHDRRSHAVTRQSKISDSKFDSDWHGDQPMRASHEPDHSRNRSVAKVGSKEKEDETWDCPNCNRSFVSKRSKQRHSKVCRWGSTKSQDREGTSTASLREESRLEDDVMVIKDGKEEFYPRGSSTAPIEIETESNVPGYPYIQGIYFRCHICSQKFDDLPLFEYHWKKLHRIETVANCVSCSLPFPSASELSVHRLNAHGCSCPACGKLFTIEESLRDHVWISHNRKLAYSCSVCGVAFERKLHLVNHIDTEHERDAEKRILHKCTGCSEKFLNSQDFSGHLFTHLLNYFCDLCDEKVKTTWLLNYHYEHSHRGFVAPKHPKCGIFYLPV